MNARKIVLAIAVMALMASMAVIPAEAKTISDTISRGQEKGWMIDPGTSQNPSLVVYYYPDGKGTAMVSWKQPFGTWVFLNQPTVMVNVYFSSGLPGSNWQYIYSDSIDIFSRGLPLYLQKGVYKFVIVCYSNQGAGVTLRIS